MIVLLAVASVWLGAELVRPGPLAEERSVVIPRGGGVVQVARQLAESGVVRWAPLVVATAAAERLAAGHELRAGEYLFAPGVNVLDVVDQLRHGRTVVHRLTVPEGLTTAQVAALVKGEPALAGEVPESPPDGSLLPDTYHFSLGDGRGALLQRMHAAMTATLTELWAGRAAGLPLSSPAEAVVLASIVEKETAVASERARIAGVFYNRLAAGMRLQSDPTVIYGLTGGKGALGRPLTQADWHHDSRYNTYQIDGLPPGPIGNPGRAALQAVLNPEHHGFLYFVADCGGGHAFARTLAEHNRNVAHWRQLQHPTAEHDKNGG